MKSIKNNIIISILGLVFVIFLVGCGRPSPRQILENVGEIDFSAGEVLHQIDTHGGLHGDGYTLIEVQCTGDVEQLINESEAEILYYCEYDT